jgi:hypothetical protein
MVLVASAALGDAVVAGAGDAELLVLALLPLLPRLSLLLLMPLLPLLLLVVRVVASEVLEAHNAQSMQSLGEKFCSTDTNTLQQASAVQVASGQITPVGSQCGRSWAR